MTASPSRPRSADPEFRRATAADWDELWPIWHEVVAAGDTYTYPPETTEAQARGLWIEAPGIQTWVVSLDGEVVGLYKIAPNQPGPGDHVANGSYMVDARIRGRGLGRHMVTHSLRAARRAGFEAIQFNAVVATNTGAIRLYEDLGFTTVGVVPEAFRHPTQGRVGFHIMYRTLEDQPTD